MAIVLLLLIYLIFISLGLPDSVLGSAFPAIAENLNVSPDLSGYIGFVISLCTIISSLLSDRMIRRFSTKFVVSFSILLTAAGLLCFQFVGSDTTWAFFLVAVPMGLGAGAIDAALNNYVALHYKALHMNWLHCSWGVGASISPLLIAPFIDSANRSEGWAKGVLLISLIQFGIATISFIALPLWGKTESLSRGKMVQTEEKKAPSKKEVFVNPVFYLAMLGFFCYCGLETTSGAWGGFFFRLGRGFSTQEAARLDSLFYIGITLGRFASGFLSLKVKEKNMIRIGEAILLLGAALCAVPFHGAFAISGFLLIGLGCAPIYPAIIRSTPYRFSKSLSQHIMGLEMAIAYLGNLIISPLFGLVASSFDLYGALPYLVLCFALLMVACHEAINIKLGRRDKNLSDEEKKEYAAA